MQIRQLEARDYPRIVAVVDEWWGRPMTSLLPRLFFDHFNQTSFFAEEGGELAGFLCGFLSPSRPAEAYIHFVGVAPARRRGGAGKRLYEAFFALARQHERRVVRAITSPVNERSIAFHRAMGFDVVPGDAERNGVSFFRAYDGLDGDRVVFEKRL